MQIKIFKKSKNYSWHWSFKNYREWHLFLDNKSNWTGAWCYVITHFAITLESSVEDDIVYSSNLGGDSRWASSWRKTVDHATRWWFYLSQLANQRVYQELIHRNRPLKNAHRLRRFLGLSRFRSRSMEQDTFTRKRVTSARHNSKTSQRL